MYYLTDNKHYLISKMCYVLCVMCYVLNNNYFFFKARNMCQLKASSLIVKVDSLRRKAERVRKG